ncbi:putative AC transposase [Mycena kentingensis (nom. inval.)]|nr:putative AC transposase [Mycena kentingensis (nom. inval.)]
MLPDDVTARKEAARQTARSIEEFTVPMASIPKETKFSNEKLVQLAVRWAIVTDQPIDALEKEAFKEMMEMAARSPSGTIKLPNARLTRQIVLDNFATYIRDTRKELADVEGMISLDCDAWSADNAGSYFDVNAHYIKESGSGPTRTWTLETRIIGFVNLIHHTGKHLGQAMFKVCERVGIVSKVGYVTSDNPTVNDKMMEEFGRLVFNATGEKYDAVERRVRCASHVVNIGAQRIISATSKSPTYNPAEPEAHMPAVDDVAGKVRAVAVKARSSEKQQDIFEQIQLAVTKPKEGEKVRVLKPVLDMKVRWSSHLFMLGRAYELRKSFDRYLEQRIWEETNEEKRAKLGQLKITEEQWDKVRKLIRVLQVADEVQQVCSAEEYPTLHLVIPALERMHRQWSKLQDNPDYSELVEPMQAAVNVAADYYDRTSRCDAYTWAMALDPENQFSYCKKNWSDDEYSALVEHTEDLFKQRYRKVHQKLRSDQNRNAATAPKVAKLRRAQFGLPSVEDSSDSDGAADEEEEAEDAAGFEKHEASLIAALSKDAEDSVWDWELDDDCYEDVEKSA